MPRNKTPQRGFCRSAHRTAGGSRGSSAANALAGSPTPAALAPESSGGCCAPGGFLVAPSDGLSNSRRLGTVALYLLRELQGISKEIQDGLEFGFKRVIASTPMRPATCFRHLGGQVDGGSLCAKLRRQFNPDPQKRGGALGRGFLRPGASQDETKWSFLRQLILAFAAERQKKAEEVVKE